MTEGFNPRPRSVDETIISQFAKANEHRDFKIYERSMDAALLAKAQSIFPYFGELTHGAVIVDAGSGTGALAELAANEWREEGVNVYALDLSHELQEQARNGQSFSHLVFGDASEQNFPENSVDVKYFSTSGHEIETFGGEGRMEQATKITYDELVPGGKIIIRDFAKPSREEPIYMQIISTVGYDDPAQATKDGIIDYSLLSTQALFERFHQEFRGGNAFDFENATINGQTYIKLEPEWAHEFYLRKDYTANWRQEIQEKYTYWSGEQAQQVLDNAGYTDIQVIPDPNEFILNNRIKGKVALFDTDADGQLIPLEFPPTHMVVIGVKPGQKNSITPTAITDETSRLADYQTLKESIAYDQENSVLKIGEQIFEIDDQHAPATGSKKQAFWLEGEPKRVIKTIRKDGLNDHTLFKAMYQSITREHILDTFNIPHPRIVEVDPQGPPYRYYIQEAAPEGSVCSADIIKDGTLSEQDVAQMAEMVNVFELGKEWQLDTNPFNWHRVTNTDGSTQMIYVDGKIYTYDEAWEFRKKGLLQWTNPSYVTDVAISTAKIPTTQEYEAFEEKWGADNSQVATWWKKYLSPLTQPTDTSR